MASNSFGEIFRMTTFGESHGPAIGVVIDGCPANIPITKEEIDSSLARRRPGRGAYASSRKEDDEVEVLSGIANGLTLGTPIALLIRNQAVDLTYHRPVYRPGHAHFTYHHKYQNEGAISRASARETASRVAAGAIAKKLLVLHDIKCTAFVSELAGIAISNTDLNRVDQSPLFCPDPAAEELMIRALDAIHKEGDSVGGIVSCIAHVPIGLGDPVYRRLDAELAHAMLSIPASKGFEIGDGFSSARMKGSEHSDLFTRSSEGTIQLTTNHCGGTLGGISCGTPLTFRVAFKPIPSIQRKQQTFTYDGDPTPLTLNKRNDVTAAIRAVPVVEAMTALVLADALLAHHSILKEHEERIHTGDKLP